MFHGSIPAEMRRILAELCAPHRAAPAWVGCSGNFTIERLLWSLGFRAVHGNDVQLYTCAMGHLFAGQPFRLELKEPGTYGWLVPGLATPSGRVATLMLLSKAGFVLKRSGRYHERVFQAYVAKWPELHAKLVERLEKVETRLATFAGADVVDWADTIPRAGVTALAFPPFYAGDYTNQFKGLDAMFDWDPPAFVEMDEERKNLLLERVMGCERWILGLHQRRPEIDHQLIGMTQTTNRGVPIYIYSNLGRSVIRVVQPRQELEALPVPKLSASEPIGSTLKVVRINGGQFSLLRSQYMNANIRPGAPPFCYAVLVDGKVVGAMAFDRGSNQAIFEAHGMAPGAYMLSDFAIRPTLYKRLSKLVVMAALSKEIKHDLESTFRQRINSILTTAFSDNAVSMKYRGIYDLHSRKENKPPPGSAHGHQKWMLNYISAAGRWTLPQVLAEWKAKHAGVAE